nr:STAS domain-containing protein [Streptomyces sp. SID8367]
MTVRGELDYASSPELLDQAAEALHHRGESTDMAVDCQELTFIDSVGLSALLEIHRDAAAVGVAVHVTGVGPRLEKILRTTGTYTHLTGHDPTEPTD